MSSAFTRLTREVKRLGDLSNNGIFYRQDQHILTRGIALIIGPEDSAYANCLFTFQFDFPSDYPFSPPKVKFLTNDGKTRFHPNLYQDGKVCLSILGTWSGPGWQSTMSFSMILLSLKALLDSNPLAHEPGYDRRTLHDEYALHYSQYVQHQSIAITIQQLKEGTMFDADLKEHIPVLKSRLRSTLLEKVRYADVRYPHLPYSMSGVTKWKRLLADIEEITPA
jgi:hypothetical protein